MKNNDILKETWKTTDKNLDSFIKSYTKINKISQDNIQTIFNDINISFDELYKYANSTVLNRFKRHLESNMELYDNYTQYNAKKLIKATRIKNSDIIQFLINEVYIIQQKNIDEIENLMFENISEDVYNKELQNIKKDMKVSETHRWTRRLLMAIMLTPNNKGYLWNDYKQSLIPYNGSEIYRQFVVNLRNKKTNNVNDPIFQKIFLTQNKRYINKKKDEQEEKYSGALDEEVSTIVNQTKLELYKEVGIKKIVFIAVTDRKTTRMCNSLNNQEFYLDKINKYNRYSALDERIIEYTTKGLQLGDNLPPINNNFHYCRSTIKYLI